MQYPNIELTFNNSGVNDVISDSITKFVFPDAIFEDPEFDYLTSKISTQFILDLLEGYTIPNFDEVYSFISNNPNIIELIQNINLILKDYFEGGNYNLKIIHNMEYDDCKLALIIKLDYSKYSSKEIVDKLMDFNRAIRPLKRELNLTNKFFADVACL